MLDQDDDSSESQNFPADVLIHNHRLNRSFTESFSNPKSEDPMSQNRFISRHRNLTTSSTSNEALVFRLVINRMHVLRIIAGVFFAAPLLGIVVGFLCGRPDTGMETSNAIFAMIPAMVASCALVLVEGGTV